MKYNSCAEIDNNFNLGKGCSKRDLSIIKNYTITGHPYCVHRVKNARQSDVPNQAMLTAAAKQQ
jgi:hypothetical protein